MTQLHDQPTVAAPKKKHRVFLWFFLAVQVLFVIWLVTGLKATGGSGAEAHAQAVRDCAGTGWQGLYRSYQECVTHLGNTYNAASDAGKGIGAGLVIGLWVAADVILGIGRFIVVFARRKEAP